jgi:peptidyl-prolyl cis-trans isomerase A (cyclophilin A)
MKALLAVLVSGAALLAQAPPAKAPAKKTAPKSVTAASSRPNPALLNPAAFRAKAPELFRVKFHTTHGDFVVEVHRDWAPLGADRFYNLVRGRFFNDVAFYRYSKNFIVQFGTSPDPRITAAWSKAPIKDEPVKEHNVKGTITFAKADAPNTRTTQFFINLNDNSKFLDAAGFAPFGTVTEGMDVLEGLYSGYGEMKEMNNPGGVSQQLLEEQGKPYLDKNFPNLDRILSATIIFPEATAAPATKKAASPVKKSPAAAKKK